MNAKIIVLMATLGFCAAVDWAYEGPNGPSQWAANFEDCALESQSPIHIYSNETVLDTSLDLFKHSMFTAPPTSMNIVNNGHSLQVNLEGGYVISDRSVLPHDYKAAQFHLHWAAEGSDNGAEHLLNDVHYFAELHIVHHQTRYTTLGDAVHVDQGLAVIGVFIQATSHEDNLEFERLLTPNTTLEGQNHTYANRFALERFLPHDLFYYRYQGSLTTPPCAESVVWSVMREPIRISPAQKLKLQRGLLGHLSNGTVVNIGDNFRPIQPINGRQITRPMDCNSSPVNLPSLHIVTLALLALSATILRM